MRFAWQCGRSSGSRQDCALAGAPGCRLPKFLSRTRLCCVLMTSLGYRRIESHSLCCGIVFVRELMTDFTQAFRRGIQPRKSKSYRTNDNPTNMTCESMPGLMRPRLALEM